MRVAVESTGVQFVIAGLSLSKLPANPPTPSLPLSPPFRDGKVAVRTTVVLPLSLHLYQDRSNTIGSNLRVAKTASPNLDLLPVNTVFIVAVITGSKRNILQ